MSDGRGQAVRHDRHAAHGACERAIVPPHKPKHSRRLQAKCGRSSFEQAIVEGLAASKLTPDDPTRPILLFIDGNYDGKIDIIIEDTNRDGRWDISFHDVDHDGKIDVIGYHPDGEIKPSRFEKYAARR
jgi:hypothetical protein